MKRRALLLASLMLAVGRPLSSGAQDAARQRRVFVLSNTLESDPLGRAQQAALLEGLKERGWVEGRNLRVDYRWVGNDLSRYSRSIPEVVGSSPDVIVIGGGTNMVRPMQQATGTIPIVFATATDPVGGGLVASLARPGGNITGLSQREFGLGAKALELIKQLEPRITRAAVARDPSSTGGVGQFGAIQTAAQALRVEVVPIDVRTAPAIEREIGAFANSPNGGLIVTSSSSARAHRKTLIGLAHQHRLPAVFPSSAYVSEGALSSYGIDTVHAYRGVAAYVDRILKGEKPADMPVQQPTKFELAVNLKTARAIGLAVPQAVLLRADKIID